MFARQNCYIKLCCSLWCYSAYIASLITYYYYLLKSSLAKTFFKSKWCNPWKIPSLNPASQAKNLGKILHTNFVMITSWFVPVLRNKSVCVCIHSYPWIPFLKGLPSFYMSSAMDTGLHCSHKLWFSVWFHPSLTKLKYRCSQSSNFRGRFITSYNFLLPLIMTFEITEAVRITSHCHKTKTAQWCHDRGTHLKNVKLAPSLYLWYKKIPEKSITLLIESLIIFACICCVFLSDHIMATVWIVKVSLA